MTQWGAPWEEGEPVDPNPGSPVPPPFGYAPPPPTFGYPSYGYPAPPYAWSGYRPPADTQRPASTTAACVLAFLLGGLILLDAFLLLVGASLVQSIEQSLDQSSGLAPSLLVNGLLNVTVGAGLIVGASLLAGRRSSGRVILAVANVVAIGQSIYWTAVGTVGALPLTVLHAALAAVGLVLAWTASSTAWLQPRP